MNNSLGIKLSDGSDHWQIDAILADKYSYRLEEPLSEKWIFYDTFDWRLYNKSLILYLSGRELILRGLSNGEYRDGLTCNNWSAFAAGLQESTLKHNLQSIIGVRSLLILTEIHTIARVYRILNKEEKTVSRLVFVEARLSPDDSTPPLATYLNIQPVRGYPRYTMQLEQDIDPLGFTISMWEDVYRSALKAVRINPGGYSADLGLQLDPDQHSDQAIRAVLHRLLEIMRANEAGIKADIDTEFLHDYRIAIRKTRAVLSQMGDVFPTEVAGRFKKDFAYLGKRSNDLRDLDVYLLAKNKYRAMLPRDMREDITPLFTYMKRHRAEALNHVIQGLESEEYAVILKDWKELLNTQTNDSDTVSTAAIPILDLARMRIFKRYRRIVKDGYKILENMQDDQLHALRIECKKLRYLIEFFGSLFPRKKVVKLTKQLKSLQNNLGDFNDLSVQQEYLLGIAKRLPVYDEYAKRALIATGYLVDNLAHRQLVVKANFAKIFTDFTAPENQKLYYELFEYKKKGSSS